MLYIARDVQGEKQREYDFASFKSEEDNSSKESLWLNLLRLRIYGLPRLLHKDISDTDPRDK